MPENVRALIVVLALAAPVFYIGRQLAAGTITPREFALWRNAWIAVTVVAFLFGSYSVFAALIVAICIYARASHAATVGLFVVLLLAVPLSRVAIPGFGIVNLLLVLNNGRLLAIVLLFPIVFTAFRLSRQNDSVYLLPDRLVVGYVLLQIALEIQRTEVTQFLRSATLFTLDELIPYFAFSRAVTSVTDLRRVLLAVVIAVLPLSLIGTFETAKGWLLYGSIVINWSELGLTYLRRGEILRATATAFTPIVLGFVIMVAVGCLLALWQTIKARKPAGIAFAILGAGLLATVSRGPWIGTLVLILVYLATGPNAVANLTRFAAIGALISAPLLLTPFGQRLLEALPFIGSVDTGSVAYRQHLFDNAISVIERNPWFGSPDYLLTPEMQEMMQGEHIIDIVNSYLKIALDSGLVGLSFFVSIFVAILIGLRRTLKFATIVDVDLKNYARASMATLIAILVTIGTVSFVDFIPWIYWSIVGLCVALTRIAYQERSIAGRAADLSRIAA
jgi:O-antigen ligase